MLDQLLTKMNDDGIPVLAQETFRHYYTKLLHNETMFYDESMIRPLENALKYEEIARVEKSRSPHLDRVVVIKLNGGLGTGMGLEKAKSLLPAKNGLTFLDIIARNIQALRKRQHAAVPLLLMNSFSTEQDSMKAMDAYPDLAQQSLPLSFLQNRIPKIDSNTMGPVNWQENPSLEWCPPGHGDIYTALQTSGTLEQLLQQGFEYAFVSNADNLGAHLDTAILDFMAERNIDFLMEAATRTPADKKGGHIAVRNNGRLMLRESAQCREEDLPAFRDIEKYRYFNTNNLWVNLHALKRKLDTHEGILGLPLIINHKTVDPKDPESTKVLQLETAMGAALEVFDKPAVLHVPRTRFAPVKTTNDLLALWSDCYQLNDMMNVVPNPERTLSPILIHLDSNYFKIMDEFSARFYDGPPSLLHCESLYVKGDFKFGGQLTFKGRVSLNNPTDKQILFSHC